MLPVRGRGKVKDTRKGRFSADVADCRRSTQPTAQLCILEKGVAIFLHRLQLQSAPRDQLWRSLVSVQEVLRHKWMSSEAVACKQLK